MPESLVGPSWRLRHLRIPTTDRYTTPYRGFEAMEEKDSDYFFGRQRETVEVLALAGAPAACDRDRMASRWFPSYWRWKSRPRGGRPPASPEVRGLIREMSIANPLWGAPRIHGELLKLGINVGQTTVAKYMATKRRPPSQGWKTFLRNHADGIVAMDMFVVPTVSFRWLYGLLILQPARRELLWLG
jgi:hypothetical protein